MERKFELPENFHAKRAILEFINDTGRSWDWQFLVRALTLQSRRLETIWEFAMERIACVTTGRTEEVAGDACAVAATEPTSGIVTSAPHSTFCGCSASSKALARQRRAQTHCYVECRWKWRWFDMAASAERERTFENAHFRAALGLRVCALEVPAGTHCHNARVGDSTHAPCERDVDKHAVHAELCGVGPIRQRTHKAMARTLGWCLKRAGANVDFERVAPHLYYWRRDGTCEEAYMDVWCSWPGAFNNCKADVTVRSPFAGRYQQADKKPGVAADVAAGDEERRYGAEV